MQVTLLLLLIALRPKTFDYDAAQFPSMHLQSGNHYGLLAQDVEQLLPNLINNLIEPDVRDTIGRIIHPAVDFKAVNYIELIPIMLKGMQEQNALISSQQTTIDSLIQSIQNGGSPRIINPKDLHQKIELSDKQGIIINQNDPNPWKESTTITYMIPSSVREAKIMFTDNKGTVLRTAKIESRGEGSLEVYASELSSGIYTYTLVCDGKVVESKKMMKTN